MENAGQETTFRCRILTVRKMSAKLALVVFRRQLGTTQGAIHQEEAVVSQRTVRWIERIPTGSAAAVKGHIEKADQPVTGSTKHDFELSIRELQLMFRRPQAATRRRGRYWKPRHRSRQTDSSLTQSTHVDVKDHIPPQCRSLQSLPVLSRFQGICPDSYTQSTRRGYRTLVPMFSSLQLWTTSIPCLKSSWRSKCV